MNKEQFKRQVSFLLDLLPLISSSGAFALKGGTAINLFTENMPRLSVDIDLTYLPLESREETLKNIHQFLKELEEKSQRRFSGIRTQALPSDPPDQARQLICNLFDIQVKIEINTVIRGSVLTPSVKPLCEKAQNLFGRFVEINTLAEEDLYAGKLCAALDRQHPRDLFDMMIFMERTPLTDKFKTAFLFYLLSHNRPISELLNPNRLDIHRSYQTDFEGMTEETVSIDNLLETREKMIKSLHSLLTSKDREFLISFKKGEPKWDLADDKNLPNYPSVQWKLQNIKAIPPDKHLVSLKKLEEILFSTILK